MSASSRIVAGLGLGALALLPGSGAHASDHNEPAPEIVWPSSKPLHAAWDLSDLFAWYDRETDRLNFIVAWNPQQLPRRPGEQTVYSDDVLYTIHVRYERAGKHLFSSHFDREMTFRYGQNDEGEWGMLAMGLPGVSALVLDCASPQGWRGEAFRTASSNEILLASGMFDDPFVFDLDGFNASEQRALDGEVGLRFDPTVDTFEGHNITAFVVSLPMADIEAAWDDFDRDASSPTNEIQVWATARIPEGS